MTNLLTEERLVELHALFRLFDKDSDGFIDTEELKSVLRSLGYSPTEKDMRDIIHDVIIYNGGRTSFSGFLEIMKHRMTETDEEEELSQAFKVFDHDGKGFIGASELRHIMTNLGEKLSEEELSAMIKAADKDGDGRINYHEFVKMMTAD